MASLYETFIKSIIFSIRGGGDAMEAVDKTNEMEAKLYAKFESICRKIPYPQNTSYRDMNEQERKAYKQIY